MLREHRILVVDDEEKVLDSITRIFFNEPRISVVTATDPKKALQIASTGDIDLVVTDQQMPCMTGVELLGNIMQARPDVITIVLTGYSDVDVILKAINDIGVYKFILKPWRNEDLYWTVIRALETKEVVDDRNRLQRELKKRDSCLNNLENQHPGITKVKRDISGAVIIDEL